MKTLKYIIILTLAFNHPLASPQPLKEIHKSSQEIRLLNLLNSLYLTLEQTQFILTRTKELERLKKQDPGLPKEYLESLEGIKEDLKKDNFVTDEKREEFQEIKGSIEKVKKEYRGMARQFALEIKDTLTPIQQRIIEDYKPCIIPPKGPARIGQAGESIGPQKKLEKIYNMPEDLYNEHKGELAEKAIERWGRREEQGLSEKILEFFDKARALDEIEFEANKERLAKEFKELFPRPKPDLATKIQRFLLNPEIIPLLEKKT